MIVEKQIDEYTKEIWAFNMFNLTAVFISYQRLIKPKGKRKWVIEKNWDKYTRSHFTNIDEPVIPEIIKSEITQEIIKQIKVKTWAEWKAS